MENTALMKEKRDTLVSDLKSLISDAEDLLRNTGQQFSQQSDDRYRNARLRFENTLNNAKSGLSSLEQSVSARTRDAMDSTDQYVKEHPWQSVGIGALAGLAVGFVMMMRR